MTLSPIPPGLMLDRPPVSDRLYWRYGYNVRSRQGALETLGLSTRVRGVTGDPISLGGARVRSIYVTPSSTAGQILAASVDRVTLIDYDPASTTDSGTSWRTADITPVSGYTPPTDALAEPAPASTVIPATWWYTDQEDVVVGSPAGVPGMPTFAWDRDRGNPFAPLANSPTQAVGGGIVSRILVLLGCTSYGSEAPDMTIRWSDQYNFEDWTPGVTNISGELQLEGGSRIVGGGVVSQGVVAWTDKRMALLSETGSSASVFRRTYVDGGRGLLANRAWCEADGVVYWMDETRTLNAWSGGRPVQIPNPLRSGTIERADDVQLARAYMVTNREFGEVIVWYPDPNDATGQLWLGLVYSYIDRVWSLWRLNRHAWGQRVGSIRNIASDDDNRMYFHDIDAGMDRLYRPLLDFDPLPAGPYGPEPYDWGVESCLLSTPAPSEATVQLRRYIQDHIPLGQPGYGGRDRLTATVYAYGAPTLTSDYRVDRQEIARGQSTFDTRAQGKALRITLTGVGHRTVWRMGAGDALLGIGGER